MTTLFAVSALLMYGQAEGGSTPSTTVMTLCTGTLQGTPNWEAVNFTTLCLPIPKYCTSYSTSAAVRVRYTTVHTVVGFCEVITGRQGLATITVGIVR